MTSDNHIIALENVSYRYKEEGPLVLDNVSFSIPKGKWTSIVGHNGSGKSTLTKLLVGIETQSEGTIYFNDTQINTRNLNLLRKNIGIVFQNPENQFVGSTVEYDVAFGLENYAVEYQTMQHIVPEVLRDVGMLEYRNAEPASLSGGQKQRVAIAGVLAINTEVIILDEAISMLDPEGRKEVLELIRKIQRERQITVISITHDLNEVVDADHLIVVDRGKVYEEGRPEDVLTYGKPLDSIGLEYPFAMRMYNMVGHDLKYLTYEELVDQL
ncbi:energy-coupling factor transporter ATPase [Staphylococcus sp. SQ8-PEA]|uniref:Energy-coupling factor transporter ATPase n=1 Tax=Staphylococcus marylandisciuri TaxID=2981529 RepID=A0ABT2QMC9_9STAP|nr:energy-coupling factor transporter ATPase [Staphylococcus marylandisciuri]MCU5745132.1 energy-coupling factor transporter ATPase [Staphylococcus marylandisciuri]